jgi:hypothetical protein
MTGRPALFALFSLCFSISTAHAQTPAAVPSVPPAAPTVTVTATASGVRFAALGPIRQTRLEVYDESGARVFDSDFLAGNVRDWGAQGRGLADGSYTCVLTARDLPGRLSIKQGTVVLSGGEVSLALGGAEPAGAVEAQPGAEQQGAATPQADDGGGAASRRIEG